MNFINNKATKRIFVVGVLVVLIFVGGIKPASAWNFGILDKIVLGQVWISGTTKESLTEDVSGIVKDSNGRVVSAKNNSTFGTAYNNMIEIGNTKAASDLAAEMSALYDKILPLEEEKLQLMRQSTIDNKARIDQLNLEIITAQRELFQSQSDKKMGSFFPVSPDEADTRVAAQQERAESSANESIYCVRWSDGVSIPGCIAILSYFILYLTSWVLFVAALLFDYTLQFTLSMTDIVNSFSTIQYGWEVFRNLINLFFILILVFISISTILQVDSYGYKKLLGKLVIAAILINFSMFFTKVIIDVSNITALVFYKQIMIDAENAVSKTPRKADGVVTGTLNSAADKMAEKTNQNLSLGIMDALGLQTIWGVSKDTGGGTSMGSAGQTASNNPAINSGASIAKEGGAETALNPWTMTLVGLGGSVFILILAFVFFAATGMFLVRTAVLIMLIVTSPIAFAANILPQTSKLSSKWWTKLNSAVLFAPVYMLLMFVTLKIIWGRGDQVTNLLSVLSNSEHSSMNSIFFFFLLCFLLVMCLTAAASIGAMGSKTMNSWGKTFKNFAVNRATSVPSRLADMTSRSTTLGKMATGNSAIGRFIGSRALQNADKLAKSKLGGTSSYRDRVKSTQTAIESRAKLAEGNLKRRAGESDVDYYYRTGYREDRLERKDGESDAAYNTRVGAIISGLTTTGYKSGKDRTTDVSRAYGVVEGADGKTALKQGYLFRGSETAAMARLEDMKKKEKEKESSEKAKEQLQRIRTQLHTRGEQTAPDPITGLPVTTPAQGELADISNFLRTTLDSRNANHAATINSAQLIVSRINADARAGTAGSIETQTLEMKRLLDAHRVRLMEEKQALRDAVNSSCEAFDLAEQGVAAGTTTPNQVDDAHRRYVMAAQALDTAHKDLNDFDTTRTGLTNRLTRMDELNIAQSQIDISSRPAPPPPGTP